MKILKGAITSLAEEGRITLQIPQYDIWIGKDLEEVGQSETEEVPDNWIVLLRSNRSPALGKERGYYFLTEAGWEANKDKIEDAFSKSKFKRGNWFDFEAYAINHFKKVKEASMKRLAYLEMKIEQVKKCLT